MTLYKILTADGRASHGGTGQWFLPTKRRPGKWMPLVAPVLCESGYHVVTGPYLLDWLDRAGLAVFEAEVRGRVHESPEKSAHESARLIRRLRWDDATERLFAADCAARVLHLYERKYSADTRPRDAIVAARAFARGEIGAAARAAAWAAAGAAAGDAARAAAWAAARAAAGAAARAAAEAAERAWQNDRLLAYLHGTVTEAAV